MVVATSRRWRPGVLVKWGKLVQRDKLAGIKYISHGDVGLQLRMLYCI